MEIAVGPGDTHFPISQTAQARSERRQVGTEHTRIGHQYDVRPQQFAVLAQEGVQTGGANLFLTLEDEFHVVAQAALANEILESLDLNERLTLVVVGTASPDATVGHGERKRRRTPQLERLGRHDVVVRVDQHRRRRGVDTLLRVDQGVARRGHDARLVGPGGQQQVTPMGGTAIDVRPMLGLSADTGNADEAGPLVQKARLVRADILLYFHHLVFRIPHDGWPSAPGGKGFRPQCYEFPATRPRQSGAARGRTNATPVFPVVVLVKTDVALVRPVAAPVFPRQATVTPRAPV